MKSIVRVLARLYPASWRARYGAEFDALLEDAPPSARQALDVFLGAMSMQIATWNFGKIVAISAVVGLVLASIGFFLKPAEYDSSTPMAIEASPDAAQSLMDKLPGTLSRESLAAISKRFILYPRERDHESPDQLVTRMQKAIVFQVDQPKPSDAPGMRHFSVHFKYSDPKVAQQVEGEIVSVLVVNNLKMREASPGGPPSRLHVLEAPNLPLKPSGPGWAQLAAVGVVVGALLGLALATLTGLIRRRNAATH
jgi:hypothetical protein